MLVILKPQTGHTEAYVKNSAALIQIVDTVKLNHGDLLLILVVFSLFTRVPIEPTKRLLEPLLHGNYLTVSLRCTYFTSGSLFYEQMKGITMGSPLSSVVANFFMEAFERDVLSIAPLKPTLYKHLVDDTFLIWLFTRF